VQTIEKIIGYLEQGILYLRWGIDSLRSFPLVQKKGTSSSKEIGGLSDKSVSVRE
jgi:hypothetical protein